MKITSVQICDYDPKTDRIEVRKPKLHPDAEDIEIMTIETDGWQVVKAVEGWGPYTHLILDLEPDETRTYYYLAKLVEETTPTQREPSDYADYAMTLKLERHAREALEFFESEYQSSAWVDWLEANSSYRITRLRQAAERVNMLRDALALSRDLDRVRVLEDVPF